MIAGTPWLFLDSGVSWKAWKSQEKPGKIKRKFPRFPGFSLCAKKPGKAKRKFTTWHSWLLLDCGVTQKAWKSQEKTLRLLGSTESNQFPGKPRKAKRKFSTLSGIFLFQKMSLDPGRLSFVNWGFLESLEKPGKPRKNFPSFPHFSCQRSWKI